MYKYASAIAILAIAGAAQAGGGDFAFDINTVDAGVVSGSEGAPITWAGAAYQDAAGTDFAPSSVFVGLVPTLGSDSYVGMDSIGQSTAAYSSTTAPALSALGPNFTASTMQGVWFTTAAIGSGAQAGLDGRQGIFIGKLTLPEGSTPTTDGILVNIIDDATDANGALTTFRFGELVSDSRDEGALAQSYELTWITKDSAIADTVSYDLYVVTAIPTPGALALTGVAGLAAVRRRRR